MKNVFGKKHGQYILLDHLGEGGMARVYNALDARIERNVAIKVILPSKHSSEVFQEQFEREARALANLVHTNIVKVLDYGMEAGQPYLVMEYAQCVYAFPAQGLTGRERVTLVVRDADRETARFTVDLSTIR